MILQCRLADLNVEFDLTYERTFNELSSYSSSFNTPDIKISIDESDFELERKFAFGEYNAFFHDKTLEITAVFRKFAEKMPSFDAAVLHSCAFTVGGRGIALGAHSGTGKTTHMLLWQELFGDKFIVINGDKPLIRFIDDEFYMYGSPWAGKEGLNNNIMVPLTDFCQIERSESNETLPLSKEDATTLLMKQMYMPSDSQMRIKTIALIGRIVEKVRFWKICCNMDIEAAEVAYKAIFGDKNEEK